MHPIESVHQHVGMSVPALDIARIFEALPDLRQILGGTFIIDSCEEGGACSRDRTWYLIDDILALSTHNTCRL